LAPIAFETGHVEDGEFIKIGDIADQAGFDQLLGHDFAAAFDVHG